MNQRETINLLNSIMPDIISSKDPEGTMLKCAEAHNLSPAQLEKLGQTFNTAKTIVGLEKQANRGDSFKIVDVPSLITKYASYSPEKALSNKSKKIHEKVDSLFDDQDGWSACITVQKSASTASLPDLNKILASHYASVNNGVVDSTDEESYLIDNPLAGATWQWNTKMASAETSMYREVEDTMRLAEDTVEQLLFEIPIELSEKCASIKRKLTPDEGRWAEAAEDIHDALGEKSASVIAAIEEYFSNVNHKYDAPADFSKRASTRYLVQDRHGVLDTAKEIVELQEMFAKVASTETKTKKNKNKTQQNNTNTQAPTPGGNPSSKGGRSNAPAAKGNSAIIPSITYSAPQLKDVDSDDVALEDYTPKPVEDLTAILDAMGPGIKGLIPNQEDIFNTKSIDTLESILNKVGPRSDSRAKAIDNAVRQAQMDTTLQQLMLSDDVISEADPNEVQNLFSTLSSISPTLATDPGKMGPALKEALQYGSVPINILSDASKLEGQVIKNEKDRADVERSKYSL